MYKMINPPSVSVSPRYSAGIEIQAPQRWLFISGQVGRDANGEIPDGIEAQADIAWRNVLDVLKTAGIQPAAVTDVLVHATTVVTNAVIERKGPRTALLVTEGFRDILSIRDEHRYEMFDPQIEFPEPLIAREMTFGVA